MTMKMKHLNTSTGASLAAYDDTGYLPVFASIFGN
jgi:hypothetical protein